METPSSARRVTRSQAISRKVQESEKGVSKSRQRIGNQQDRSALIDITNDSPIVGLAMGGLGTPSSTMSKKRNNYSQEKQSTPGSGEALLRDQVKNLLQKVEEEADSLMGILAPSTVNAISNGLASVTSSSIEEQFKISMMVNDLFEGKNQESSSVESKKSLITRSLLLDFSEKTEDSVSSECDSVLTYQLESENSIEDDDASNWSIQVNASTRDDEEDDDDQLCIEEDSEIDNDYEDEGLVAELCEEMKRISVNGVKFSGKHIRFVYNSDDEIQGEEQEEVIDGENEEFSSSMLRLKGLPTPKGKHLRFVEEEEEEFA